VAGDEVFFKDPETGVTYGQCDNGTFSGFTFPLRLYGAFGVYVEQGRIGACGEAYPGDPKVYAKIEFALNGWYMKSFGIEYLHVGNLAFNLAVGPVSPWFDSFSGQAAFCLGTMGRCAVCELGSTADYCARTIKAAVYMGASKDSFFVRAELYSRVSLKNMLETLDLDKVIGTIPDGLNFIEFGPRPGQRAAVFSVAAESQTLSRGYDVKTQSYDGNTVTIEAGLVVDCRVTLFPSTDWLRWNADMLLVIGKKTVPDRLYPGPDHLGLRQLRERLYL
jgi:hypothetical protein